MRLIYDEDSPFTGRRRVAVERDNKFDDILKMCMDTGYQTYVKAFKEGSEKADYVLSQYPPRLQETVRVIDGQIWVKVMLMSPYSVLVPEKEEDGTPIWVMYALKEQESEDEEVILALEDEENEGQHKHMVINPESRQQFPEDQFEKAMDAYQMVGAMVRGMVNDTIQGMINDESDD